MSKTKNEIGFDRPLEPSGALGAVKKPTAAGGHDEPWARSRKCVPLNRDARG